MNKTLKDINAYKKRRAARLDEYQNGENWVTIRGVHVLLDKHGNVINNFSDPQHKLKNLRFVDAVSSHTEGGKKVIDAPLQRKTLEQKFNESMQKLGGALAGGVVNKEDAQKRMANALASLEQGAVVKTDNLAALKLGKGLYKVKGQKGNITAKQLAEKIMSGVSTNGFSPDAEGMPEVKPGTNTNIIQKGSKRITHVAKNALEDLYNKYKSNKYSHEGLQKLSKEYIASLPKGTELQVNGNKFTKADAGYWKIEHDGSSHKLSPTSVSMILLNSMKTGYAGGTINAKVPETAASTETKIEKAAEKIAEKKPETVKEPEKAPEPVPESYPSEESIEEMAAEYEKESAPKADKLLSESMADIAKGPGYFAEKMDKMAEFLKGLPDGTPITYEAVNKITGKPYFVKGTKTGDKIKFTTKEAPIHAIAATFVKKIESGKAVGGSDESMFPKATEETKATETSKAEEKPAEEHKTTETPAPAESAKTSTPPAKTFTTDRLNKASAIAYDTSKYTPEKKEKAKAEWDKPYYFKTVNDKYKEKSNKWYYSLPGEVRGWFKSYTGSGYSSVNNTLRNAGTDGIGDYAKSKINKMTEAVAQCKFDEPTYLRRGLSFYTFAGMVGMTEKQLTSAVKSGTDKVKELFLDGVAVENGFASCGSTKNTGFKGKSVDMEIYCPEGTEAVFANPFSEHPSYSGESGEFETILQRGSAFKITDISVDMGRLKVKCELVAQKVLLDNFGDDLSSKLAA